jgi:hypothetical protein
VLEPADLLESYYTEKLWGLLPEVYRTLDGEGTVGDGALREVVARIGRQAAIVRRSIDRLWEDQSIETCDNWVIPYIGDLVATNVVAELDGRGQRLDVAKTIYYRRRKGTVAMLEELVTDITGWRARIVEMFRRLERTRHGFDPPLGLPAGTSDPAGARRLQAAELLVGPMTGTPIGGLADLRDRHGATRAHTPFDEFFHTTDVRPGGETTGWHGIPRLGIFLWRLRSYGVPLTDPVPVANCPGQFTFDPTGRELPLFAAGTRPEGDVSVSAPEWRLPAPLAASLLRARTAELYPDSVAVLRLQGLRFDPFDPTDVTVHPEQGRLRVPAAQPAGELRVTYHYGFSSDIGAGPYDRRRFGPSDDLATPTPRRPVSGGRATLAAPLGAIAPVGTIVVEDSLTYTTVAPVGTPTAAIDDVRIEGADGERPVIRLTPQEWEFTGSGNASRLRLENLLISGADVVLKGTFDRVEIASCTLDPGQTGPENVLFAKAADGRPLRPARLVVEAAVRLLAIDRSILGGIRTRAGGRIARVVVRDSIVQAIPTAGTIALAPAHIKDPRRLVLGLLQPSDPLTIHLRTGLTQPTRDALAWPRPAGLLQAVTADLSALIDGPSLYDPDRFAQVALAPETLARALSAPTGTELKRLNRILLEEAYPVELADRAFALIGGELRLERCTVLGRAHVHRLWASECILDDRVVVEDAQAGCVRFSAWSAGSVLPRRYESVRIAPAAPLFRTRTFGHPDYAQLLSTADHAILDEPVTGSVVAGGPEGSELGAFAGERNPIRLRSLRIKLAEFMPVGLAPVTVMMT